VSSLRYDLNDYTRMLFAKFSRKEVNLIGSIWAEGEVTVRRVSGAHCNAHTLHSVLRSESITHSTNQPRLHLSFMFHCFLFYSLRSGFTISVLYYTKPTQIYQLYDISHRGERDILPQQHIKNLWWTKWLWESSFFLWVLPLSHVSNTDSASFHQCSILCFPLSV
jgi:hypothetical protein